MKQIKGLRIEQVGWRLFDGEGGYDFISYDYNEDYYDKWIKRNPRHESWLEPVYCIYEKE